ncbi:MAG: hypothetical protein ACREL7_10295 [Longimicrobiales bacterium]
MEKKRYTPPEITDLGNAVEATKGVYGNCWEIWGSLTCPPSDPPPPIEEE